MKIKVSLLVLVISVNSILASCESPQVATTTEEIPVYTKSPSETPISTWTTSPEPTKEHSDFEVIEANCPTFVSNQEVELGDGFLIYDSRDPYFQRDIGEVAILNTRTGYFQVEWTDNLAISSRYDISPDKTKLLYFDDTSMIHITTLDGTEYPIAYWNSEWGTSVDWFDNERLVVWPEGEWKTGTLIVLDPFEGSWEIVQHNFPSGLNVGRPYVSYNKDFGVGLYICGENFCLWDVNSGTDISMFKSTSTNFVWRLPERDKIAMVISDDNYGEVGELMVVDESGLMLLTTNFGEAYSQCSMTLIEKLTWSPNGRYIALSLSLEDRALGTLIAIDVSAKKAVDYCLQIPRFSPIVWSPDSSKVMITRPVDIDKYLQTVNTPEHQTGEVVVLDIEETVATITFNETVATGWMVLPE